MAASNTLTILLGNYNSRTFNQLEHLTGAHQYSEFCDWAYKSEYYKEGFSCGPDTILIKDCSWSRVDQDHPLSISYFDRGTNFRSIAWAIEHCDAIVFDVSYLRLDEYSREPITLRELDYCFNYAFDKTTFYRYSDIIDKEAFKRKVYESTLYIQWKERLREIKRYVDYERTLQSGDQVRYQSEDYYASIRNSNEQRLYQGSSTEESVRLDPLTFEWNEIL